MNQLTKLLSRDIVFYPVCGATLGEPLYAEVGGAHPHGQIVNENERAVAVWTLTNNKRAGATTATLADARCLYLAVRTGEQVFGVVGIVMGPRGLDAFENSIMLSIIGECALALAREKEARERQEAAIVARNEQLRANLLRSIGHDLRTPLTAISGSAAILRDAGDRLAPEKRAELAGNIHRDALWLIDMMENPAHRHALRGRFPSASTSPRSSWMMCSLRAAAHLARQAAGHRIVIERPTGSCSRAWTRALVMQLLVNLIGNAVKYTPEGSTVTVSARRVGDMVRISVADDGPGVPDADKERIFDRFRTGAAARRPADATRSFGLGLALCRSIAEAHGGYHRGARQRSPWRRVHVYASRRGGLRS